jgi:hypothetical protein
MATTGIAAELLHEGTTVHRKLCRAKHVDAATSINVDPFSIMGEVIQQAHVLIIDEISMQHKDVLEYVDRLVKSVTPRDDLRNVNFAGKVNLYFKIFTNFFYQVVILGGDWKQLTPVVPGGNSYANYLASVKTSDLFPHFSRWQLRVNHRLQADQFAYKNFLLKLGTGLLNDKQQRVQLPESICLNDPSELFDWIFPKRILDDPVNNWEEFADRVILSPLNKETLLINKEIMVLFCVMTHLIKLFRNTCLVLSKRI